MSRLTFADAVTLLSPFVSYATDPALTAKTQSAINFCCAKFIKDRWKSVRAEMFIAVYNNVITTPPEIETVDKIIMIGPENPQLYTSSENVNIQPMWYEYSDNGLGLFPSNYSGDTQCIRQGDGFCTFQDPPATGSTFTITKEAATETGQFLVKANDVNGNPIWNGGVEGILINLATQLPFTSADSITSIYEINKPQTNGRIFLKYTTPTLTTAGVYSPNETSPNYQRYRIVGQNPEQRLCKALVQKAFVMLKNSYDLVIPSDINALRYGVQAYIYDQQNELERAQVYWRKAYAELDKELEKFEGQATRRQIDVEMKAFALGGPNGIQNLI